MRQTLFYIPHEVWGVPVFGFGWMFLFWLLFTCGLLAYLLWRQGWNEDTKSYVLGLTMLGLAIVFVLPLLEEGSQGGPFAQMGRWLTGEPEPGPPPYGIPIRGYGMMMLLGVASGVGIVALRAPRVGVNPEQIYSLAFWMFLGGITGARLFFVIQKWEEFQRPTLSQTIVEIFRFTEGGLVVYGAVIGGLLAGVLYLRKRNLPLLATGDLIAPGMLLGLAFGRIGCLLNGCCYGGYCETEWLALRFPPSPPYVEQLHDGRLLGMRLEREANDETTTRVAAVEPGGSAHQKGLREGDRLQSLYIAPMSKFKTAFRDPSFDEPLVALRTERDTWANWYRHELPRRSLPVHGTQVYAAVNAALLSLLLWLWYPFRRRDGEAFAGMLTLYPISRFALEAIRQDEAGQFGTVLTISQWISIFVLVAAIALWIYLLTRPAAAR